METARRLLGRPADEARPPPLRGRPGPRRFVGFREGLSDDLVDHRARHALGKELLAEPPASQGRSGVHPADSERAIVHVPPGFEIGEDRLGDLRGGSPATEPLPKVPSGPGLATQEVERDGAGPREIQDTRSGPRRAAAGSHADTALRHPPSSA